MPNWCENTIKVLSTDNTHKIFLKNLYSYGMSYYLPTPKELSDTVAPNIINSTEMLNKYGYTDWYDWNINNWGTKWDMSDQYLDLNNDILNYLTAWSPNIDFFNNIINNFSNLYIVHYYYEPGMVFNGVCIYNLMFSTYYYNSNYVYLDEGNFPIRIRTSKNIAFPITFSSRTTYDIQVFDEKITIDKQYINIVHEDNNIAFGAFAKDIDIVLYNSEYIDIKPFNIRIPNYCIQYLFDVIREVENNEST